MTTFAAPASPRVDPREYHANISRVPYLPGLDGMRALAVVAVMIYHANSTWLPGGFLGVEMFFVISGYLITLLIIAERERTYTVSLTAFWKRRARRLLPALFVLLAGVTIYTVVFEPDAVGQLRGDVIASALYGANWYQLFVGLGYTAAFDFAPLRHLWSLAVEEQFYLVWPLVMIALLGRRGTRRIANVSRWLFVAAVAIAIFTALAYHPGFIGEPEQTPEAYWWIGDRPISKLDFLYIGSFSRASGILLGAAFAMVWRPFAVARGPLGRRGPVFDVVALVSLAGFAWMCWNLYLVTPEGTADGRLFQGGLFLSSVLTVFVIAAVSHPRARTNRVLGNRVLVWIGVRSYGLYLFHWPVYQAIRGLAGNKLTVMEFVVAMAITAVITEASFRLVETPIRKGTFLAGVRSLRRSTHPGRRNATVVGFAAVGALTVFAGATLATAEVKQNEIADDLAAAQDDTVSLSDVGFDADVPVPITVAVPLDPPDGRVDDLVPATTEAAPVTTSAMTETTVVSSATTLPATTEPGTTLPATTVPVVPGTTVPVVPATTAPPPPPPPPAPTQLGVVSDLSTVTPLGIPPAGGPNAVPIIALGDSVMLGAAGELAAKGVFVDAATSRQFTAYLPEVQAIKDLGRLGSVVVVHLGTNGSFSQSSLDSMMAILADVPVVIFVTGKADRSWVGGNNEMIRALPSVYPNVTVIDWEVLGRQCPGDCFYDDNIHLNQNGQNYYADIVGRVIGI